MNLFPSITRSVNWSDPIKIVHLKTKSNKLLVFTRTALANYCRSRWRNESPLLPTRPNYPVLAPTWLNHYISLTGTLIKGGLQTQTAVTHEVHRNPLNLNNPLYGFSDGEFSRSKSWRDDSEAKWMILKILGGQNTMVDDSPKKPRSRTVIYETKNNYPAGSWTFMGQTS